VGERIKPFAIHFSLFGRVIAGVLGHGELGKSSWAHGQTHEHVRMSEDIDGALFLDDRQWMFGVDYAFTGQFDPSVSILIRLAVVSNTVVRKRERLLVLVSDVSLKVLECAIVDNDVPANEHSAIIKLILVPVPAGDAEADIVVRLGRQRGVEDGAGDGASDGSHGGGRSVRQTAAWVDYIGVQLKVDRTPVKVGSNSGQLSRVHRSPVNFLLPSYIVC
jgi:hypothetical protein